MDIFREATVLSGADTKMIGTFSRHAQRQIYRLRKMHPIFKFKPLIMPSEPRDNSEAILKKVKFCIGLHKLKLLMLTMLIEWGGLSGQ